MVSLRLTMSLLFIYPFDLLSLDNAIIVDL